MNSLKETILRKNQNLSNIKSSLDNLLNETRGTKGILNKKLDEEIETILSRYYEIKSQTENLEIKLNELKMNKNDLQAQIGEIEVTTRKANSEYNKKQNELKDIQIQITRLESKLDNLLLRLNEEYEITYEKAIKEFELKEDLNTARSKVNTLKRDIKILGEVNTGAISEYERINKRFEFLSKQKEDLETSIKDILEVINELDTTMKERLMSTYEELNQEFGRVFTKLFKGGEGKLVLTDPNDILNTGLEIYAVPPGKDIKNTDFFPVENQRYSNSTTFCYSKY